MCRSEADRGNNISRTVLGDAYRQHTLPGLATTVAFVRACLAVAAADREIPTARTGIHDWINAWADVDTAYRTTREAPGRPRPAPNPSRDSGPDALMQSPSAEARDPGRPFGPIAVDISPAERALAEALRALFRTVGAPMSRIAYALGADKGTLSRYLKGTRVPPWEFVDALIHQADLNSGHRITNNHIEALRSLHREALAVRNPKGAELHRLKEALHATESALHFAHEQATEEIMRLTALLAEFGAQARQARPHGGPPRRVLEQGAVNPGAHRRKGGGPRPGASRPGEEGPYGIYGEDDPETDDRTPDADNRDQAVSTTDRRRR
ncbi:hypothetical protein OG216_45665 [Streptomycetaceae bacterium NBC_01309]